MTLLTHRPPGKSAEFRRLLMVANCEARTIKIGILPDAATEKEAEDFMADPDIGEMVVDGVFGPEKGDSVAIVSMQ